MTVVSLHAKMANNLIIMFYACHYHDHPKASVMHAQAGCFLSNTLRSVLDDDIMLLYAYN